MKKEKNIIVLFCLITFVFLFSKNIIPIFETMFGYFLGDIYVTYEDFPDIGEWLQITTSVLFSYLLLRATNKSNELNENNLTLQEYIYKKQEEYKLANIIFELKELYTDIISINKIINDKAISLPLNYQFSLFADKKFDINQDSLIHLYTMYEVDYENIMNHIKTINVLVESISNMINNKEMIPEVFYNDMFVSRVRSIINANSKLETELENLIKELEQKLKNKESIKI